MSYCRGDKDNLEVTEIEGKAWHDNDLYLVKCKKCGARDKCLARRPRGVIIKCEG
jgi:translation initiation factor 2 beta subunit (eIF-2beta)/eIF-5